MLVSGKLFSGKEKKAIVLGVSADSASSHAKFATKYDLSFPLLSDEKKEVLAAL